MICCDYFVFMDLFVDIPYTFFPFISFLLVSVFLVVSCMSSLTLIQESFFDMARLFVQYYQGRNEDRCRVKQIKKMYWHW